MKLLTALAAGLSMMVAVAAENLVKNPSFESDETAFVVNRMETPRERVKAKDDPRYVSRPDTLHVRDGKRAWFLRCENPKGRNNMAFTNLPVMPGKRYVFKARYYLDDDEGPTMVWGNYHEHDKDGKTSGYLNLSHFDATPVQWNLFTCTFYASAKSSSVNVELVFSGKMSVWVDEVSFAEDVRPPLAPSVGAKLLETDAFAASWLSPLTKAMPSGVPADLRSGDGAVHLDAARNEKESFQLVLGAKRDLRNVTVKVSDFVREKGFWGLFGGDARIGTGAATVREVKFVPITNAKNLWMNRLHPDPVVAFDRGSAASGSNLVALVTVKVPTEAEAGDYGAAVTVAADGIAPASIPVRLRVRNFALPDTAKLKSYFYANLNYGGGSYTQFDARPKGEILNDFYGIYRELRWTGNQAMDRPEPKRKMVDGHVVITDWSPYDDEVSRLIGKFNLSTFPVPFVGMLGDNSGWFKGKQGTRKSPSGRMVGAGPKETPFGGFFDEPEGRRYVIEALTQFAAHAKEKFPGVEFIWYFYDEPPFEVMDVLPKMLKVYRDALKGIRFLVVAVPPYADWLERFDIRVAQFDGSTVHPRVRNFGESWYYQYPASIEDDDYLCNRFFPWQVYQGDGAGVLLWNVVWYGPAKKGAHNPWTELTAMYESAYATVFYPPRPGVDKGVVMSMRAVNIGDAIEDFDYLKLCEEKVGKDAVRGWLSSVLPEVTATPTNPFAFLKLRKRMAEALEK